MEKLHIALAPHKHLPPEILAEVFLHCSLDGKLGVLIPSSHPLPAPWVLGHVCSRWRRIALGEKRLWNSIYYEGNLRRHVFLLEEAFKHSGQSTLQLEASDSPSYPSFLREVVLPQSHRITSLLLDFSAAVTLVDFLFLPSGLFSELECVKLHVTSVQILGYHSVPQAPATVFQRASRLRRITVPVLDEYSPLDLALPWDQLTYLALTPGFMKPSDSFKVLSLCPNLCECRLCPYFDPLESPTVFLPASIQLPLLQKLVLYVVLMTNSYADVFRPLVFPKLKQLAVVLSSPSEGYLNDLRKTIGSLSIPDLRLELHYAGKEEGGIVRLARFLPPLTSIKAYGCTLSASMMTLIGQETYFQALTSLETRIGLHNTKGLVEMFKAHWVRAQQSNNTHTGIRSATIEAIDVSEKDISEFSRDIAVIQKELGVVDANITLRRQRSHPSRWWLY